MRKDFIINLAKEIIQVNQNNAPLDNIFAMMEDILIFLEGSDMKECEANQYMVEIANLFREYAIKVRKE